MKQREHEDSDPSVTDLLVLHRCGMVDRARKSLQLGV